MNGYVSLIFSIHFLFKSFFKDLEKSLTKAADQVTREVNKTWESYHSSVLLVSLLTMSILNMSIGFNAIKDKATVGYFPLLKEISGICDH